MDTTALERSGSSGFPTLRLGCWDRVPRVGFVCAVRTHHPRCGVWGTRTGSPSTDPELGVSSFRVLHAEGAHTGPHFADLGCTKQRAVRGDCESRLWFACRPALGGGPRVSDVTVGGVGRGQFSLASLSNLTGSALSWLCCLLSICSISAQPVRA